MITYQNLIKILSKQKYFKLRIKDKYLILRPIDKIAKSNYHITIYQDQWDDYRKITKMPYYLFHISSNSIENKCSSYFRISIRKNKIGSIPNKYFKYNQPTYSFYQSTRFPCKISDIYLLLKYFQKILNSIQLGI